MQADFDNVLAANPRDALALCGRAATLAAMGTLDPPDLPASPGTDAAGTAGEYAAAAADCDRAVELDERCWLAYQNRGLVAKLQAQAKRQEGNDEEEEEEDDAEDGDNGPDKNPAAATRMGGTNAGAPPARTLCTRSLAKKCIVWPCR